MVTHSIAFLIILEEMEGNEILMEVGQDVVVQGVLVGYMEHRHKHV